MNQIISFFRDFAAEDDGAQIIEYALIVAVISLSLIILMNTELATTSFQAWLDDVQACLTTATCAR
jgi:pilus assembly protein Flp/PilA